MSTKPKLKLKKMKDFPNILHVDSNLVLKSLEDKTVIGKYENRNIVLLNNTDIDLCNNWKLVYDPEKVNDEDQEQDEDHEVNEEEKDHVDDDHEDENDHVDDEEEKDHNEVNEEEKEKDHVDEDHEEEKVHVDENQENKHVGDNNTFTASKDILDITVQFTKDIHKHFDILTHFYTEKISEYQNKISNMDIQYTNLLGKYTAECNDHSNTKEDLKKLQSKFEGIKSLFN